MDASNQLARIAGPEGANAMFFHELNRGKCKTYILGCERTRQAVLIDPLKENTARYIAVAAYHGYHFQYPTTAAALSISPISPARRS
jgi:hypothetical protein